MKHTIGFGRVIIPDKDDKKFLMKSVLPEAPSERTSRYWNGNGWWGDQGSTSQCVGYSWAHWVEDGPVTHKGKAPIVHPSILYREAQKIDEWEGEAYDGTSVRAGAKYLQSQGLIEKYVWAWDIKPVIQAILEKGPVVVGTYWYDSMLEPDSAGLVKVEGSVVGGHAYVLNGVNTKKELFRIKNSWGRHWGKDGYAYISFKDMQKLIKQAGEACLAVELKKD